jgi:short-subunit dehydrogenase
VDADDGREGLGMNATMPYAASKSFVQSFALALRNELKDTGVKVTSLMPGPVETDFFARGDMLDTKVGAGAKDDPADVARDGFKALMAGRTPPGPPRQSGHSRFDPGQLSSRSR